MRSGFVVALLGIATSSALAGDISLSYKPLWPGFSPRNATIPVKIEISNKGANTIGLLKITGGSEPMTYPVELPQGAQKSVVVYIPSTDYGESMTLELPKSSVVQPIELTHDGGDDSKFIGVISQTQGSLSGIRPPSGKSNGLIDTYCSPEEAPVRSIAYSGMRMVILSRGAERISDDSVAALKRFVLRGGTLMFCGGPSPLTLRDARWQSLLPFHVLSTKNLHGSEALSSYANAEMDKELTVSVGELGPSAQILIGDKPNPLVIRSRVGLGYVVVSTFDLFDDPIRTWAGRKEVLKGVTNGGDLADVYLSQISGENRYDTNSYGSNGQNDDPFELKLAQPLQVILILGAFLVVAVPLNFFALSKLRRRELAWATLPAISLLFSSAIFATTGNLYKSKQAKSTFGVLVVNDGLDQGVFVGRQLLFFPQAGRYDLGFKDVELAAEPSQFGRNFGIQGQTKAPDLMDVGQVVAPDFEVSNLAFREFRLRQGIQTNWQIQFNPMIIKNGATYSVSGKLTNSSPFALKKARLWCGSNVVNLPDLAPGASKSINETVSPNKGSSWSQGASPPIGNAIALEAVSDFPVGSQLGTEVSGRGDNRLLYVWNKVVPE